MKGQIPFMIQIYKNIKFLYNKHIRQQTPKTTALQTRVKVPEYAHILDIHKTDSRTEAGLINGMSTVRSGDTITLVGAGNGVSTTWAARLTGESGHVFAYEGANEQVDIARQTVKANNVSKCVTVKNAVVGTAVDVYGDGEVSKNVEPPTDLPKSDVLVLDCEGAEYDILTRLEELPRAIVVEVHPAKLDSNSSVYDWLVDNNYSVSMFGHRGYPVPEASWEKLLDGHQGEVASGPPVLVGRNLDKR